MRDERVITVLTVNLLSPQKFRHKQEDIKVTREKDVPHVMALYIYLTI